MFADRSLVAALALALVAYLVVAGVLYAALRWTQSDGVDAASVTLLPGEPDCSEDRDRCAAPASAVRSERGLAPVASRERPDDVLDRRAAEDAGTRFDEQCRPLPAVASESAAAAAGSGPDASTPPAGRAGAANGGNAHDPAVAPTPAPPDLARAQPQRFVLMVEVEARHDPDARP